MLLLLLLRGVGVWAVGEWIADAIAQWCYGLSIFRLDWSRTYIDPLWRWLYEDVRITDIPKRDMLKRVYKWPGTCEQRNVCLSVGNALSVYARDGLTTAAVIERLRRDGHWKRFGRYAKDRGRDPQVLIRDGLLRRRLVGQAA